MLSTIKLKTLAKIITCTLAVYLCFSVLESRFHTEKLSELHKEWDHYRSYQNEKIRLRAHLISALGYGGLIHIYDNYILRKTDELRQESWQKLGNVKSIIEDLNRLAKSEGERVSLQDIIVIVDRLGKNLVHIESYIAQGLSSLEIHNIVENVDYSRASRAITRLGEELVNEVPDAQSSKFNLAIKMRSLVGINGMIQSYKRYVLHCELEDLEKTQSFINKINQTIDTYLEAMPNSGERIALEDIRHTINKYESSLDIIKQGYSENMSAELIDNEVRVNDEIALRGFELLEAEQIDQIEARAGAVVNIINQMELEKSIYSIFHFVFFVLVIILLNYIMHAFVINPIRDVSNALNQLAEGDLNVDIAKKVVSDNEIGKLEKAFEVFKVHEIERTESEAQLRKLAMTDVLTGLANRAQLERRYPELISIAKRKKESIATLMLDLDNFKAVNDTLGHGVGDKLLQTVSEALKSELRDTDIIARLGGDEFVIILFAPNTQDDVSNTAQRIIDKISKLEPAYGSNIRVGTSIGIVIESDDITEDINDVLEKADKSLYDAKNTGKNKYVYHSDLLKLKNPIRQLG